MKIDQEQGQGKWKEEEGAGKEAILMELILTENYQYLGLSSALHAPIQNFRKHYYW